MYRLSGKNGLFGFRYIDSDRALEAKQSYIEEHKAHRAGIVQRNFHDSGMKILFSEAEGIAVDQMNNEITIEKV